MNIRTPLIHPITAFAPDNTEGNKFIQVWCSQCSKVEKTAKGDLIANSCPILNAAKTYSDTHQNYPKEWCVDSKGLPVCTAFSLPEKTHHIDISQLKRASDLVVDTRVVA